MLNKKQKEKFLKIQDIFHMILKAYHNNKRDDFESAVEELKKVVNKHDKAGD